MARITEISASRRGSKRRRILVDGEPWREASSEALAKADVTEGLEADVAQLAAALDAVEPQCARDRALRLLAYRERSTADLAGRLTEDGYPAHVVRDVVSDLERMGLVDDARYSHALVHSLAVVRGLGRTRVLRDLSKAGIDEDLATRTLDEMRPLEDESDAALALARKAARRKGATVEKVAASVVRRGFAPRIAFASARAALVEFGDPGSGDEEYDVFDR